MRLRVYSYPIAYIGSIYDYLVPAYDMPNYPADIGYRINSKFVETIGGSVFFYGAKPFKYLRFNFDLISEDTMKVFNSICGSSHINNVYLTILMFGSLVNVASSISWHNVNGQTFGTGFLYFDGIPKLVDYNLYSCTLEFISFSY